MASKKQALVTVANKGIGKGIARGAGASWLHRLVDGEICLITQPAMRDWKANRLESRLAFHLRHCVMADLAARAEPSPRYGGPSPQI